MRASRIFPVPIAALALVVAVGLPAAPAPASAAHRPPHRACLVPGVGKPLDAIWHPHFVPAIGYNDTRAGDVAFAVRTDHRFYGYRPDHTEWSASIVKAMLMVTYLDLPSVRGRLLGGYGRSLLGPMITVSDNNAAQQVFNTVGQAGLRGLANRVGMSHFATSPIWGETEVTARDQTQFFLHIDSYVVALHRRYAMRLLANIVPSERWGIGEVAPKGWRLYFKGGWGYGTGLIDSQVALLVRGCARVSVAVLTMNDGSHAYGKQTLRGIFSRLLRGLPTPQKRKHHRHRHLPRQQAAPAPRRASRRPSAIDSPRTNGGGYAPSFPPRAARPEVCFGEDELPPQGQPWRCADGDRGIGSQSTIGVE